MMSDRAFGVFFWIVFLLALVIMIVGLVVGIHFVRKYW